MTIWAHFACKCREAFNTSATLAAKKKRCRCWCQVPDVMALISGMAPFYTKRCRRLGVPGLSGSRVTEVDIPVQRMSKNETQKEKAKEASGSQWLARDARLWG